MQPNKATYKTNNNKKNMNTTNELTHEEHKQQQKENKKPTPTTTFSNKFQKKKHSFYNGSNFIKTRQHQLRQLKKEQQETLKKYPPESSTSAAKRYERYQQVLKDQQRMIIEQQQQQQQELGKLSLQDQIRLDFYGTLSVTIEKDKQQQEEKPVYMQKGPALWPDKNMYQGGHIRQQEERQESTSMDITMLDLKQSHNKTSEKSTTYIKDIAKSRGRAFFESMAIARRQQEKQQQLKKDEQNDKKNNNKDDYKQYAVRDNSKTKEVLSAKKKQQRSTMKKEGIELLSHDDIENLMNGIYPESHWKEIPACQSLYTSLFGDEHDSNDSSESEDDQEKEKDQLPWTEKHRPICVTDLLGDHHAYNYLLDWLQQLKVNSHSFEYQPQEHQDKEQSKLQKKRQRREGKKESSSELAFENLSLDGQQQREEMDEWDYPSFSDNDQESDDDENDSDFMMEQETRKRSRPQRRQVKEQVQKKVNSNLMLIFGPHGVGKTASIYTAANQVGYEVFEIHPGMRRAGKDLMALVGEMTESHQVNFVGQQEVQSQQLPSNQKDISSMFQKTLTTTMVSKKRIQQEKDSKEDPMFTKKRRTTTTATTKSGTVTSIQKKTAGSSIMSHFARVKSSVDPFMVSEREEEEEVVEDEDMDVDAIDNESITEQQQRIVPTKQSLILLEEVDILYEEDKGFWTAVLELVQKNTDMVPLDTMKIEKAIEIVPQTTQSLIPYLQLLCFKEGYMINPSDLFYLVATMGSDLRQLIHTLEMW
ncbi:hypothetical protein INT45_004665, partial [Circinella minor]